MARSIRLTMLAILAVGFFDMPIARAGKGAVEIVAQIQRADYEGNRAALRSLYGELKPFGENPGLATRVRYWRGFAMWRRALNGFNESVGSAELEEDLKIAENEFDDALAMDAAFVDATALLNNNLYKTRSLGYVLINAELRSSPRYDDYPIRKNMAARPRNDE